MKYIIVFLLSVLLIGCSKDEDPVSTDENEPFNGVYMYEGNGIFDSVASTPGYLQKLGVFNFYGGYDTLFFNFSVKTNYKYSKVSFRSDSNVNIYKICEGFIGDSSYHNYIYKIQLPSDDVAYMNIILGTGHKKYIVVKDLKVYVK